MVAPVYGDEGFVHCIGPCRCRCNGSCVGLCTCVRCEVDSPCRRGRVPRGLWHVPLSVIY